MYRKPARILLAAVFVIAGGSTLAWAQVERSGNTFHRAVCPGHAGPGEARCHAHVVTDANGNPFERAATRNLTPSGYNPQNLWTAYGITPTIGTTFTAATPIIAIVDAYGYNNAESDLNVYRSQWKLGACTTANGCFTKYNQSGVKGNYPRQNTGWAQETALDLDMASAMCPSCRIILVEANSSSFANLAAAESMAAAKGAHVISNSYGGSESGGAGYVGYYSYTGVAITVSTGDSGYGAEFPATAPTVTAVGGTSLSYPNGVRTETAWSGGGSGCSTVFAKPAWQQGSAYGVCAYRMEADVSAVADPNTGVAVYGPSGFFGSAWQVYGGTSVAAPLIAGIYGNNGGAVPSYLGTTNPYSGGSLLDITSGSNGSCGGTPLCTAGPGYDGPTGWGTPKGNSAF
jgi:subtilase family serine protease